MNTCVTITKPDGTKETVTLEEFRLRNGPVIPPAKTFTLYPRGGKQPRGSFYYVRGNGVEALFRERK